MMTNSSSDPCIDATESPRYDGRDLNRLRVVAAALRSGGARWWVDHGTLLALVREGKPFPWDDDIDLSYDGRDHATVVTALLGCKHRLAARLLVTQRYVKIVPYVARERIIDVAAYRALADGRWEKHLVRAEPSVAGPRRMQFQLLRYLGRLVDTALASADRVAWAHGRPPAPLDAWTVAIGSTVARLRDHVAQARPSTVSAGHFERLGEIAWETLRLPAPKDQAAYLELRYGPSWLVRQQSWTWWNDDRTVHHERG